MTSKHYIEQEGYLRERLQPKCGDPIYLVLSDILIALRGDATDAPVRVLDFGAGGSPYRSLFPNADYRRADIPMVTGLDYRIQDDGTVDAPSSDFDVVLSTQVAEHVPNPATYFSECHRVLKPGGRLICTTHGMYEEHGCPYDYQRWTLNGLKRDLQRAGFAIEKGVKITAGARSGLFFFDRGVTRTPAKDVFTWLLWLQRGAWKLFRPLIHRLADGSFPHLRVVNDDRDAYMWYVCVYVVARKPGDTAA